MKNGGWLRYLERRARLQAATEGRRQARGIGTSPRPRSMSAAERRGNSAFRLNADGSAPKPGDPRFIGPPMPDNSKADMMGDGGPTKPGASSSDGALTSMAADLKALRQDVHERLPKKSV